MCVAEKYFDDICYPPELPNELHRQKQALLRIEGG